MLEHLDTFKDAFISEFYQLYDRHQDDQIYACALIFNEFLLIEDLAISTEQSICDADDENHAQYLSPQDRWETQKWRFRASAHPHNSLNYFRNALAEYFQKQHLFGNPLLENQTSTELSHLTVLFATIQEIKQQLHDAYGLDTTSILFFVSLTQQPDFEIQSAQQLNPNHPLLNQFIHAKKQKGITAKLRQKLSQADKDLLTDLEQMLRLEPYDYLKIATDAYILTLEPYFIDCHPHIQQFIQTIVAMSSNTDGHCAMSKEKILLRINQFYPNHQGQQTNNNNAFSDLPSENLITLAFIDRI